MALGVEVSPLRGVVSILILVVIPLSECILQAQILLEVLLTHLAFKAMYVKAFGATAEFRYIDALQALIEENGSSKVIACLETCNL